MQVKQRYTGTTGTQQKIKFICRKDHFLILNLLCKTPLWWKKHDGTFQRLEWRQFQPLCFQNALNCTMDSERGQECWRTWWERQAGDNLISSLNKRLIQGLMGLCRGPQCQICYEKTAVCLECVAESQLTGLWTDSFLLFIKQSSLSSPMKHAMMSL